MAASKNRKGITMVTNLDRAEWAAAALRHFQCITGTEYDDALTDLICDLMHWSDREDIDFQSALDTARMHYEAECEESGEERSEGLQADRPFQERRQDDDHRRNRDLRKSFGAR